MEKEQILKNLIRLREETREYKAGIEKLREKLKSNVERGKADGKLYKEISNCLLRLVDDYFSFHSKWVNEILNPPKVKRIDN